MAFLIGLLSWKINENPCRYQHVSWLCVIFDFLILKQGSYGQDKVRISQDFDLLGQDKTEIKKVRIKSGFWPPGVGIGQIIGFFSICQYLLVSVSAKFWYRYSIFAEVLVSLHLLLRTRLLFQIFIYIFFMLKILCILKKILLAIIEC